MKALASVQDTTLGIQDIGDDVVHLRGDQYRSVLEVSSLNFNLKSEGEQEGVLDSYAAFLNGLNYPVQVLVRVLPVDTERYLTDLSERGRRDPSPALADLARDHVAFVRRLARTRTLLERRFYTVVPAESQHVRRSWRPWPFRKSRPAYVTPNGIQQQLTYRSDEIARQLGRCDLHARRLDDLELAQLSYSCLCPELAQTQRLRRELSDYTALVVSADRRRSPVREIQDGSEAGPVVEEPAVESPGSFARFLAAARALAGRLPWSRKHSMPARMTADEMRFARGTRSVADLIAPAAVEVRPSYLRLEQQYVRTLAVHTVPRTVSAGWLAPLVDFEAPIDISMHIQPLETGAMVKMLTRKMVQLHSSRMFATKGGRVSDSERELAYKDAETLRDLLQKGDERIFSVSLYLMLRASSLPALDELTRRVEVTLDGMRAQSHVALFEQDTGFRACLPEGWDGLLVPRNMDTSSLATAFPFCSSSLSMERGVLYGLAKHNHSPIIFDPFDSALENANMVLFAKSGAGKSYFTKLTAVRNLLSGVDFLIIDPEDEYRALCSAVGGQYIRVASSTGQHLNPFDLPPSDQVDETERDPLAEQITELLRLLEVMLAEAGRSFSNHERAVLDRALYQTYAAAGITADPATHRQRVPVLRDLAEALADSPGEVAASLATRLERYVDGSLAGLFAGPTNVALNRRLVVFNVQSLEPELRAVGIHLITNYIWNQVRRSRKPRLLVVDEAWTLMQYGEGGAFLSSLARRARKYYLGLMTVTQDVADFLASEHGRTVLTNAAVKLLMKQDSATIEPVVSAFQLTPEERQVLLAADKGEGIFFARGSHLALRVEASPGEHRLATTAPQELFGRTGQQERAVDEQPVLAAAGAR